MPQVVTHPLPHRGFERILRLAASRRALCQSAPTALLALGSAPAFGVRRSVASAAAQPAIQDGDDGYDLDAAVTWLLAQQLPDGGFPGPSGASDLETTIDAVTLRSRGSSRMGEAHKFLLARGPAYAAKGPGQAARLALAAIVLHEDPNSFGGRGPATAISDPPCDEFSSGGAGLMGPIVTALAGEPPGTIPWLIGRDLRDHAYALLALSASWALNDPYPETLTAPFEATQAENGGWAIDGAGNSNAADSRTTALVLQALVEWERIEAPIVQRGLAFLRSLQTPDGAFASAPTEPRIADAASTGLAMQALLANGEDRMTPAWADMRRALVRFQTPSGGFRRFMSDAEPDLPATIQAMLALSNRYLPVRYFCG